MTSSQQQQGEDILTVREVEQGLYLFGFDLATAGKLAYVATMKGLSDGDVRAWLGEAVGPRSGVEKPLAFVRSRIEAGMKPNGEAVVPPRLGRETMRRWMKYVGRNADVVQW